MDGGKRLGKKYVPFMMSQRDAFQCVPTHIWEANVIKGLQRDVVGE